LGTLADEGVVDHAADLHPDTEVELPDSRKYPFYGSKGYYRSWEATSLKSDRVEAIEEEAEKSGTRPSAVAYILNHPTAIKTALLADEPTRTAAREALEEFDARQAAADAADRAAAAEVTSERQREYDDTSSAQSGTPTPRKPAKQAKDRRPMRPWTSSTRWPRSAWPPRGRWRC
jgi:hypothetical protein